MYWAWGRMWQLAQKIYKRTRYVKKPSATAEGGRHACIVTIGPNKKNKAKTGGNHWASGKYFVFLQK